MKILLTFSVVTFFWLLLNYLLIINKMPVKHGLQQVFRSIIWIMLGIAFYRPDWQSAAYCVVAFHLAFFFPFNTGLNLMRGLPWTYISKDPNASCTDKIMALWPAAAVQGQILLFIMGIAYLIYGPQ